MDTHLTNAIKRKNLQRKSADSSTSHVQGLINLSSCEIDKKDAFTRVRERDAVMKIPLMWRE